MPRASRRNDRRAASGSTRRVASPQTKRARMMLVAAVAVSAGIMAAWFPAGALLQQRTSLNGATAQLHNLHAQDSALAQERKHLSDSSEIARIARTQYQLVNPGQRAFQVLPPSGTSSAAGTFPGDPGNQAPVAPSATSELPPGTVTSTTLPGSPSHSGKSSSASSPGIFERMLSALEFWR